MNKLTIGAALAVVALATGVGVLNAQQPGFKRIEVQDRDLSIPGRHAVQARAEVEPGGAIGRHTHPGEELSIVLEGAPTLEADAQPARTGKAGGSYFTPAGAVAAVQDVRNGTSDV